MKLLEMFLREEVMLREFKNILIVVWGFLLGMVCGFGEEVFL